MPDAVRAGVHLAPIAAMNEACMVVFTRVSVICSASLIVLLLTATPAPAQPVQGDIASVGFPVAGGPILRLGRWFPLQVRLSAQGSLAFSGRLRVTTTDLDGDRVAYERPFTVGSDIDGKRFWCYAIIDELTDLPEDVEVLDEDGLPVATLPFPPTVVESILDDDLVVLDISTQPVPHLRLLQTPGWFPSQRGIGERPFYQNIVVSTLAARDLPDQWFGLEAVDIVVWDRPDQSEISRGQLGALVAWLRHGGELVVGVGGGWQTIQGMGPLADVLPLTGAGQTIVVDDLPGLMRTLVADRDRVPSLEDGIEVTTAQPTDDAIRALGEMRYGIEKPLSLVTLRMEGAGRVTAFGPSLRDIARQADPALPEEVRIDMRRLMRLFIDLNAYTSKQREEQRNAIANLAYVEHRDLYPAISTVTGFTRTAAAGGLLTFLFVTGYIFIATLGSWYWLHNRNRGQLAWVVFAALAVLASALSLGMVTVTRGAFARGVQSVQIVDFAAGQTQAVATNLYGYATPMRRRARLTLPGDDPVVRPLARGPKRKDEYVTSARYVAEPANGTLDDVLMRATLKQFEAYWSGDLGGTIRADLIVDRFTGGVTQASWIANELSVDLDGGYLFYIDPRQVDLPPDQRWSSAPVPPRVAGLTTLYDRPRRAPPVPPAYNILVVPVPAIERGSQARALGARVYSRVARAETAWRGQKDRKLAERFTNDRDLPTLWNMHRDWAGRGWFEVGAGDPIRALLLASTRRYYLNNSRDDFNSVGEALSTHGLPEMDVTHWLVRGQALLIVWTQAGGPIPLVRDGEALPADGLGVYRVRVPLRYTGAPPGPTTLTLPGEG